MSNWYNFGEGFNALGSLLALKTWKILVTTRQYIRNISGYKIEKLDFKAAQQLYTQYEKTADESLLRQFFVQVDYNTLVIELTAKTIANSLDLNLQRFMLFLNNQQLDDSELEIEIEVGSEGTSTKIFTFLESSITHGGLSTDEKITIDFLALLPSETRVSDLVAMCGKSFEKTNKVFFINIINALHNKGWVERDKDEVKMHRVLQEVIIYRERKKNTPFSAYAIFISWLLARFQDGFRSDPATSIRFLRYGESILNAIKDQYRTGIYQPLLALENEVLNVYRWTIPKDNILDKWEDLIERAKAHLEDGDALLGVIHNNYAVALIQERQYNVIKELLVKAIQIFRNHGEEGYRQLLNSLNNLSMLYLETLDISAFRETFTECEQLRKKLGLTFDATIAAQVNALGVVNQKAGKFLEAVKLFELAIQLYSSIEKGNANVLDLIVYLNNLAFNLYITGEKDKAIKLQTKALALSRAVNFKKNRIKFVTIRILISMHEDMGNAEKVEVLKKELTDF